MASPPSLPNYRLLVLIALVAFTSSCITSTTGHKTPSTLPDKMSWMDPSSVNPDTTSRLMAALFPEAKAHDEDPLPGVPNYLGEFGWAATDSSLLDHLPTPANKAPMSSAYHTTASSTSPLSLDGADDPVPSFYRALFECDVPHLPFDLNSLGYLSPMGEFHLHGEYLMTYQYGRHTAHIVPEADSLFRMYVAPHGEVDVDLEIFVDGSDTPVATSANLPYIEESISFVLSQDVHYDIVLKYGSTATSPVCPTAAMEMSVVPVALAQTRLTNGAEGCSPGSQVPKFPDIPFADLDTQPEIYYDSATDPAAVNQIQWNPTPEPGSPDLFAFEHSWDFTLPPIGEGLTGLYTTRFVLGTHFLTGGTGGLLLQKTEDGPPGPDSVRYCALHGSCWVGTAVEMNSRVIQAALLPGNYTLTLFDHVGGYPANFQNPTCNRFHMVVDIKRIESEETRINCRAIRQPEHVNAHSLSSLGGRIHFREEVLVQLGPHGKPTVFSIGDAPALFRVFTSDHQLDLNLALFEGQSPIPVATSYKFYGEEGIAYVMKANTDYTLRVKASGTAGSAKFCDTYILEYAMAPTNSIPDFCPSLQAINPNLDGIDEALASDARSFSYPEDYDSWLSGTPYAYFWKDVARDQEVVYSKNFTLHTPSSVYIELGDDFLLGDLEIFIDAGASRLVGTHHRNRNVLMGTLQAGEHTLTISTGDISDKKIDLSAFPNCAAFHFRMDIKPAYEVKAEECRGQYRLPNTFDAIPYLGFSSDFHFMEHIVIPLPPGQATAQETVEFSVKTPSLFRVYMEPHHVNIDLYLSENGVRVDHSIQSGAAEALYYNLKPNADYQFTVKYQDIHRDPSPDRYCESFAMEVAISPDADTPTEPTCDPNDVNPPSDYISSWIDGDLPVVITDADFEYTQAASGEAPGPRPQDDPRVVAALPFNVTEETDLVAWVKYPFPVGHLVLVLVSEDRQAFWYGSSTAGRNSLPTVHVDPGKWTFYVIEELTPLKDNRQCVHWELSVGADLESDVSDPENYNFCHDRPMPHSFNSIAYFDVLDGDRLVLQRDVLITVPEYNSVDNAIIDLPNTAGKYLLRAFLPYQLRVDIDLRFCSGDIPDTTTDCTVVKESKTTGSESIMALVDPGKYYLQIIYYQRWGQPFPAPEECVAFELEVAIAPLNYVTTSPYLKKSCTNPQILPPELPHVPGFINVTINRDPSVSYEHTMTFSVDEDSVVFAEIGMDFLSSAVNMNLKGTMVTDAGWTRTETWASHLDTNRARLAEVIPPGDYELTVKAYETEKDVVGTAYGCAPFELVVFVDKLGNYTDDPTCDKTNHLPTDLFSEEGGSQGYGGPQDPATGDVRITGDKFPVGAKNQPDVVAFRSPKKSVARFYIRNDDRKVDIDLKLWNGHGRKLSDLIGRSSGIDIVESKAFILDKKKADAQPYELEVIYFRTNPEALCSQFQAEMAIRSYDEVVGDMSCNQPFHTPALPPNKINIKPGDGTAFSVISISADDFVFNPENRKKYMPYGCTLRYEIEVVVVGNATIESSVGYDFVSQNIDLRLHTAIGQTGVVPYVSYRGEPEPVPNRGSYINFKNAVRATVPTGTYILELRENRCGMDWGVDEDSICNRFSFSLVGSTTDVPHVLSVDPAGGVEIDPSFPLSLGVEFSDPVGYPTTGAALKKLLVDDNPGALMMQQKYRKKDVIYPHTVHLSHTRQVMTLTFAPDQFKFGKTYRFVFDASLLNDNNGDPFERSPAVHEYKMTSCDCHDHGYCVKANTTTGGVRSHCVCDGHWTGPGCQECVDGYHFAGGECVKNTKCKDNSCHHHGDCTDDKGYPTCTCDLGWANDRKKGWCSVCDDGFHSDSGNCVENPEQEDKELFCHSPVLPETLNNPGYLDFNGRMHISDNYWIDPDHPFHDIHFTLPAGKGDYEFRVYIAPHEIDIDIYLYRVTPEDQEDIEIAAGYTVSQQESIFRRLTSEEGQNEYRLEVHIFSFFGGGDGVCDTMNVEMELAPRAWSLARNTEAAQVYCTAAGNRLPEPPQFDGDPDTPLFYGKDEIFWIRSDPNHPPPAEGEDEDVNYYMRYEFVIPPHPTGKIPAVFAETRHRFLAGSQAVLLQAGHGMSPDDCEPSFWTDRVDCVGGQNDLNRNFLFNNLVPGNYTLYLFEPSFQDPTLSDCAPFEFILGIGYYAEPTVEFSCAAKHLPYSFDETEHAGYIHECSGYMHIEDEYLLDLGSGKTEVEFTVQEESIFRMYVPTHRVDIDLALYDLDDPSSSVAHSRHWGSAEETILYKCEAGKKYRAELHYYPPLGTEPIECETMLVEAGLQPTALVAADACPASGTAELPALVDLAVPYVFGMPDKENPHPTIWADFPYGDTQDNRLIASYPFDVTVAKAHLWVAMGVDFTRGDLSLYLRDNQNGVTSATHAFNEAFLDERLVPGNYTLEIRQLKPTLPGQAPCVEFSFIIVLLDLSEELEERLECEIPPHGAHVPTSLYSPKYLGRSHNMHLHGSNFLIPRHYPRKRTMRFGVEKPSYFRVYVDEHEIDIDLKLYDQGPERIGIDPVAKAVKSHGEETIVFPLEPDTDYELDISFITFGKTVPDCAMFSMELAIAPWDITSEGPCLLCPDKHSRWPPHTSGNLTLPPEDGEVWSWNSADRENPYPLYVQQIAASGQTESYPITILEPTRLYVEAEYDFLHADVNFQLRRAGSSSSGAFMSDNYFNREILSLNNLPVGDYILDFYEPHAAYEGYEGCGHFSFKIVAQAQAAVTDQEFHWSLPEDLNALSWLGTWGTVHLQGNYAVPRTTQYSAHHEIHFDLTERSLLRVYTEPHVLDIDMWLYNVTEDGNKHRMDHSSGWWVEESMLDVLEPGHFFVKLYFRPGKDHVPVRAHRGLAFPLELAISPMSEVMADLELAGADCGTQHPKNIAVNGAGHLHFVQDFHRGAKDSTKKGEFWRAEQTLNWDSSVMVHMGYNFLLNDVSLEISGQGIVGDDQTPTDIVVTGRNGRNVEEIGTVLPPGVYNWTMFHADGMPEELAHCYHTLWRVRVDPAAEGPGHSCDNYERVPYDLNSAESRPWGGPIDPNGALHMHGSNFLMGSDGVVDRMWMNLKQDSLIRLYTDTSLQFGYSAMSYVLRNNDTGRVYAPVEDYQSPSDLSQLFHTPGISDIGEDLVMEIHFDSTPSWEECPAFIMEMAISGYWQKQAEIMCADGQASQAKWPPTSIPPAETVVQVWESFLNSRTIREKASSPYDMVHEVSFSVLGKSRFDVDVAYDFLSTELELFLLDSEGTEVGRGSGEALAEKSSVLSFTMGMHGTLTEGDYTLRIVWPDVVFPVTFEQSELCYPYGWSFQLVPFEDAHGVTSVAPSTSTAHDPSEALTLIVTLTDRPYDANGKAIGRYRQEEFRTAWLLSDGSSGVVEASRAEAVHNSNDLQWKLRWNPGKLTGRKTYTLVLKAESLFYKDGDTVHPMTYAGAGKNVYTMLAGTCSHHGQYFPLTRTCLCAHGWSGRQCEKCGPGYHNPVGDKESCVEKPDWFCSEAGRSCGCEEGPTASTCTPLGTCDDGDKKHHHKCQCAKPYTGDHCEECAEGFFRSTGYKCEKATPCPGDSSCNGHGGCDLATGECLCLENWAGDECDHCSDDFSGDNCENALGPKWYRAMKWLRVLGVVSALGLIVTGVILFVVRQKRNRYSTYQQVFSFFQDSKSNPSELATIEDPDDPLM